MGDPIHQKGKTDLNLWCVTTIDLATGWMEIKEIPNKQADTIANIVEQTWLTRYPRPSQLNLDRGTEFMAEFSTMIQKDFGITKKTITARNPQANSIIERAHQTLGNIIRTINVNALDEEDPWSGILAATIFAMRATYHTTLQATPAHLVFGRDEILYVKFIANWQAIREQKQKLIKNS